jgi:hypothetical protein
MEFRGQIHWLSKILGDYQGREHPCAWLPGDLTDDLDVPVYKASWHIHACSQNNRVGCHKEGLEHMRRNRRLGDEQLQPAG